MPGNECHVSRHWYFCPSVAVLSHPGKIPLKRKCSQKRRILFPRCCSPWFHILSENTRLDTPSRETLLPRKNVIEKSFLKVTCRDDEPWISLLLFVIKGKSPRHIPRHDIPNLDIYPSCTRCPLTQQQTTEIFYRWMIHPAYYLRVWVRDTPSRT